jgi:hypothetical protein
VGKTGDMTAAVEEKPVGGGEEPRFDLRRIAELPAFLGPAQKRLLGQITGISLSRGETVGKLMKALIMAIDEGGVKSIRGSANRAGGIVPVFWGLLI